MRAVNYHDDYKLSEHIRFSLIFFFFGSRLLYVFMEFFFPSGMLAGWKKPSFALPVALLCIDTYRVISMECFISGIDRSFYVFFNFYVSKCVLN